MASWNEKVTEFLTCVICQELYTDPCTLKCDHTFCRKCVTAYVQTRPDAVRTKTIPCSFCRQNTKVPHPRRPVEEWAWQIKPSIIIQGLIDIQAEATDGGTNGKCCTLCGQLGETIPGISYCPDCEVTLCERCVKMHHASPLSSDHELCDLSEEVKVKKRRKVMCQEHQDKRVEYLCKDCNKSLCQSCCVVYHRKCDSVVTINSQVSRMKSELALRRSILQTKCLGKSKRIERHKVKINEVREDKAALQEEIHVNADRIIDQIRQKEKKLLDELDEITEEHLIQIHADVKLEEIEMQMYRQHCEFIDQALVSDCEMDLFDAFQAWETGTIELGGGRYTDIADTRRIDDIKITPEIEKVLNDIQMLEIDVAYRDGLECSPVLFHTTDAATEDDQVTHGMFDTTALYVDGVQISVITDWENMCVKSFWTRNSLPNHSRLPLDSPPWGVTKLKQIQVMVTLPHAHQIVTVEVTPELVLLSTITTCKGYFSLAVLSPSSLAAGGSACVDILDMAGHVLRSVTTHNDDSLFTYPAYMCVNNKGNILVSDWGKTSVTCLTSAGDVVWRYAPTGRRALSIPAGISTTKAGDILFVDKDSEIMIQLKDTGEYVSDVLTSQDGISQPLSLCIDKHDSVIVTCGREIKTYIFT